MATQGNLEQRVRIIFEAVTHDLEQQLRENINQLRQLGAQGQQAGQRAGRGLRDTTDASREAEGELRQLLEQFRRTGNAADNLSKKINTAFKAILTGYAAKQMIGFGQTAVTEYGKTQSALGEMASLGYEDLEGLRQAAVDFSNVWSGTSRDAFIKSAYDIKSGIASLSDEGVAQFTEMAGLTAKATKATIDEMTSLFATGYGIYRNDFTSDFDFGEQFAAGIAKSVQQFKTKGSEMASYLSTLGSAANQAGAELSEVLAIGGTLQATMSGSEAATKYNSFLKNALKAGKALGLNFTDANNQLLSTVEILQMLHDQYGDVLQADERYELTKVFGDEEAVKLIENLYNKIGEVRSAQGQVNSAMQEGMGFVEKMAGHMNKGILEKVEILKQSWGNLLDKMGEKMAPGVITGLDALQETILKLQDSADFAAIGDEIGDIIAKAAQLLQTALESGVLENILSMLAEHLDEIIETLVKGAGAWVAFQAAGSMVNGLLETSGGIAENINNISELGKKLQTLVSNNEQLSQLWGRMTGALGSLATRASGFGRVLLTAFLALPLPIKAIIVAIVAVIAIIGVLIATSEEFRQKAQSAMLAAKVAVLDFVASALESLERLLRKIPLIGNALGNLAAYASAQLRSIQQEAQNTYNALNNSNSSGKKQKTWGGVTPKSDSQSSSPEKNTIETPVTLMPTGGGGGGGSRGGGGSGGMTIKNTIEDKIERIADKYQPELKLYESRADLAEKQSDYTAERTNRQSMIDVLNRQVKELLGLENSQSGKNKMIVETARNKLLMQIAEITDDIRGGINSMVGEFNKPSGSSALSLYAYELANGDAAGKSYYGGNQNMQFYLTVNGDVDSRTKKKATDLAMDILNGISNIDWFSDLIAEEARERMTAN